MDVNPSMEPPVAASKRYSVVAPADAYNVVAPSVQTWHRIANANTICYNLVVKKRRDYGKNRKFICKN